MALRTFPSALRCTASLQIDSQTDGLTGQLPPACKCFVTRNVFHGSAKLWLIVHKINWSAGKRSVAFCGIDDTWRSFFEDSDLALASTRSLSVAGRIIVSHSPRVRISLRPGNLLS